MPEMMVFMIIVVILLYWLRLFNKWMKRINYELKRIRR